MSIARESRSYPAAPRLSPWLLAACCALSPPLIAGIAAAQDSGMMIVRETDDGGASGRQVMRFSAPNFFDLKKPDFVKRDLPLFNDILQLDESQQLLVNTFLAAYTEAFHKLAEEMMPGGPPGMMMFDLGAGEGGFALGGEDGDALGDLAEGALEWGGDFMLGEDVEAGTRELGIAIQAGVPGPDGEMPDGGGEEAGDGQPRATVAISLGGPDGEELPEDVRKAIEAKAAELAEKIQKQIQDQIAAGEAGGDPAANMLPMPDPEAMMRNMEEMRAKAEDFKKAKAELKQTFITDVQTQLAAEQMDHWPALDRALTRSKTLPMGRLDGERTDLIKVVDRLELGEAEREPVIDELAAYEVELHNALVARNAFIEDVTQKVDKALDEGKPDQALSLVDRATNLRVAVRTVNDQHTDLIAQSLPADEAQSFKAMVRQMSYPRVYGKSRAQRAFDVARKLPDIEPQTLQGIEELSAAYTSELEAVNSQIRETIRRHQPLEPRKMIEETQAMLSGEMHPGSPDGHALHEDPLSMIHRDEPVHEAFTKRSELDERFMRSLHGLLTPDQIAQLPKLPSKVNRKPVIIELPARIESAD